MKLTTVLEMCSAMRKVSNTGQNGFVKVEFVQLQLLVDFQLQMQVIVGRKGNESKQFCCKSSSEICALYSLKSDNFSRPITLGIGNFTCKRHEFF